MYQGTLQPRLENHWGIKTIKWRKYWRDLWFQQLPESILVKSIIKGKCPHGIQLEGQQMRKRHSSGEGGCRAGVGGEVFCSGSSPGPGWAGCGAVGREQCVDGKNTEWTLVNPWFFTSASLLQVRLKTCIVHGILQARILEWVAFPFSRGSSQPRNWTQVSHTASRFFTGWARREAWDCVLPPIKYWRS